MSTPVAYREIFVCEDTETGQEVYAFRCNACGRDLPDGPCPDHAPGTAPGMRPVDCDQTPPHVGWVVDAEDYGAPCPWCQLDAAYAQITELEIRRDWHGRWRGWSVTRWLCHRAYGLGVLSGYAEGTCRQPGHTWCASQFGWRSRRPYVLGWPRESWRCLLRNRHWPADPDIFGLCSKCLPCPDCGSRTAGHNDGCPAVPA